MQMQLVYLNTVGWVTMNVFVETSCRPLKFSWRAVCSFDHPDLIEILAPICLHILGNLWQDTEP